MAAPLPNVKAADLPSAQAKMAGMAVQANMAGPQPQQEYPRRSSRPGQIAAADTVNRHPTARGGCGGGATRPRGQGLPGGHVASPTLHVAPTRPARTQAATPAGQDAGGFFLPGEFRNS